MDKIYPAQCKRENKVDKIYPAQCKRENKVDNIYPAQCKRENKVDNIYPAQCKRENKADNIYPAQCKRESKVDKIYPAQCKRGLSMPQKLLCNPGSSNPRQTVLLQAKIFSIFRQKSQYPTDSAEMLFKLPFPQVNVVCLDSGDLLHDFFHVIEINNIEFELKGGACACQIYLFPFCDMCFREDYSWPVLHSRNSVEKET